MNVPFLLSEAQMRRIDPFFPLSHGVPRVDDRRIVSAFPSFPPAREGRYPYGLVQLLANKRPKPVEELVDQSEPKGALNNPLAKFTAHALGKFIAGKTSHFFEFAADAVE